MLSYDISIGCSFCIQPSRSHKSSFGMVCKGLAMTVIQWIKAGPIDAVFQPCSKICFFLMGSPWVPCSTSWAMSGMLSW